jgi:hypothetical protein
MHLFQRAGSITALAVLSLALSLGSARAAEKDVISFDGNALSVYQLRVDFNFGPVDGIAQQQFDVPAGKRFVIENVSGLILYTEGPAPEIMSRTMQLRLLNRGTAGPLDIVEHFIPIDHELNKDGKIYFSFNHSVRLYTEGQDVAFPDVQLENLDGLGPIFGSSSGIANVRLSGYLIDIP